MVVTLYLHSGSSSTTDGDLVPSWIQHRPTNNNPHSPLVECRYKRFENIDRMAKFCVEHITLVTIVFLSKVACLLVKGPVFYIITHTIVSHHNYVFTEFMRKKTL